MDPVIIVGAGFGGIATARALAKYWRDLGGREILLVDRNDHHLYTPLLYEVATGFDPGEALEHPDRKFESALVAGATVPLIDGLLKQLATEGIQFLHEEVLGIDATKRMVTFANGRSRSWSALVLAIGGEPDFYSIAGLKEHSFPLKTVRHALAIRRRLHALLAAKKHGEEPHISVVIGGAGATGVEFAGELVHFFERAIEREVLRPSDITVTIVEATHRVLSQFPERFARLAERRLERWCVKFYFDSCIQSVARGKVVLVPRPLRAGESEAALVCEFRTEKQKEIDADLVVWTGGVRGASQLAAWGLPVDMKGRVPVTAYGEVSGKPGLYVLGDAAALEDPRSKRPLPGLAQAAIAEARVTAAHIAHGDRAKPYQFPYLHTVIPVGGKYAIADVFGFKFDGFLGWIARQIADLRYYATVLPWPKALRTWWRGVRVYIQND